MNLWIAYVLGFLSGAVFILLWGVFLAVWLAHRQQQKTYWQSSDQYEEG